MRYIKAHWLMAATVITVASLAACHDDSTSVVTPTPQPSTTVFSAFVKTTFAADANSTPVSLDGVTFVFDADENPVAFDTLIMSGTY